MVRAATIIITVVVRVARAVITVVETADRAALTALRLVRATRTENAITVKAARAALTAAVRVDLIVEARADSTVRADRVDSTAADRAVREALDLVQWAVVWLLLLFLLTSVHRERRLLTKVKNRFITARTKSSTMITSLNRRRRLKLLQA